MSKRPKAPFKYGRNICIFCGGESDAKISDEHIWPQWAVEALPSSTGHGIFSGRVDKKDKTVSPLRDDMRQGAATNFRVRQVCKACNSGWMGTYEEEVRPFLKPMMLGEPALLSEHDQKLLVEYLTYKILILDVGFKESFIPPKSAREFYSNRTMPAGMDLHIMNCVEGEWQLRIWCIGGAFSSQNAGPKDAAEREEFRRWSW